MASSTINEKFIRGSLKADRGSGHKGRAVEPEKQLVRSSTTLVLRRLNAPRHM
jgi:hypothetical protein